MVDVDPHPSKRIPDKLQIGQMWFAPWILEDHLSHEIAPEFRYLGGRYLIDHQRNRAPIQVVLPNLDIFCVDSRARIGGIYHGEGWNVSGDAPKITLSPSIDMVGYYHGWLQLGVLSDDTEGRKYDEAGRLIK